MKIESIPAIVARASKALESVSEQEWPAIYDSLNSWRWDSRLGSKPADWDSMEEYEPPKQILWLHKKNTTARTKDNIIRPINRTIKIVVGEKALLRYHHTHNLRRTDLQFEDWWDSQKTHNFYL